MMKVINKRSHVTNRVIHKLWIKLELVKQIPEATNPINVFI